MNKIMAARERRIERFNSKTQLLVNSTVAETPESNSMKDKPEVIITEPDMVMTKPEGMITKPEVIIIKPDVLIFKPDVTTNNNVNAKTPAYID